MKFFYTIEDPHFEAWTNITFPAWASTYVMKWMWTFLKFFCWTKLIALLATFLNHILGKFIGHWCMCLVCQPFPFCYLLLHRPLKVRILHLQVIGLSRYIYYSFRYLLHWHFQLYFCFRYFIGLLMYSCRFLTACISCTGTCTYSGISRYVAASGTSMAFAVANLLHCISKYMQCSIIYVLHSPLKILYNAASSTLLSSQDTVNYMPHLLHWPFKIQCILIYILHLALRVHTVPHNL